MLCPACGAPNGSDRSACARCGERLLVPRSKTPESADRRRRAAVPPATASSSLPAGERRPKPKPRSTSLPTEAFEGGPFEGPPDLLESDPTSTEVLAPGANVSGSAIPAVSRAPLPAPVEEDDSPTEARPKSDAPWMSADLLNDATLLDPAPELLAAVERAKDDGDADPWPDDTILSAAEDTSEEPLDEPMLTEALPAEASELEPTGVGDEPLPPFERMASSLGFEEPSLPTGVSYRADTDADSETVGRGDTPEEWTSLRAGPPEISRDRDGMTDHIPAVTHAEEGEITLHGMPPIESISARAPMPMREPTSTETIEDPLRARQSWGDVQRALAAQRALAERAAEETSPPVVEEPELPSGVRRRPAVAGGDTETAHRPFDEGLVEDPLDNGTSDSSPTLHMVSDPADPFTEIGSMAEDRLPSSLRTLEPIAPAVLEMKLEAPSWLSDPSEPETAEHAPDALDARVGTELIEEPVVSAEMEAPMASGGFEEPSLTGELAPPAAEIDEGLFGLARPREPEGIASRATHLLSPEDAALWSGSLEPSPSVVYADGPRGLETLVKPLEPQSEPFLEAQPVSFARPPLDSADEDSLLGALVEESSLGLDARDDEPPPEFTIAAPGELEGRWDAGLPVPAPDQPTGPPLGVAPEALGVLSPAAAPRASTTPEPRSEVRRGLSAPLSARLPSMAEPVVPDPSRRRPPTALRPMAPFQAAEDTDPGRADLASGLESLDGELSMPGDNVSGLPEPDDGWLHAAHGSSAHLGPDEFEGVDDTRALPSFEVERVRAAALRVAPLWRRLGGMVLDATLVAALSLLVVWAWPSAESLLPRSWEPGTWVLALFEGGLALPLACGLGLAITLTGALQALAGASFGKVVFGLKLVRSKDGVRAGFVRTALRTLAMLPGLVFLGAGAAWVLIDRRCRAWHDLLSGTVVVTRSS